MSLTVAAILLFVSIVLEVVFFIAFCASPILITFGKTKNRHRKFGLLAIGSIIGMALSGLLFYAAIIFGGLTFLQSL